MRPLNYPVREVAKIPILKRPNIYVNRKLQKIDRLEYGISITISR